jgi:phosphohistidine phosphatase SixA
MKFIKLLFIITITFPSTIKADLKDNLINELQEGGKVVFIRHAYAPGSGDPENFNINNCDTQRNLSESGREQAKQIGKFFKKNNIPIHKVISSEWCRCKETAILGFNKFETSNFLNSFFNSKYEKNKNKQLKDLKTYIGNWESKGNLILITHYVVIAEFLNYTPSSGEIVISDKKFKKNGSIQINY